MLTPLPVSTPTPNPFPHALRVLAHAPRPSYNSTLFAYGQTGSGKTFTMGTDMAGPDPAGSTAAAAPVDGAESDAMVAASPFPEMASPLEDPQAGMIPRVVYDLYKRVEDLGDQAKCTVRLSMLEIHNEEIRDLLVSGG